MSDDRAKRIQRMREGRREADGAADAEAEGGDDMTAAVDAESEGAVADPTDEATTGDLDDEIRAALDGVDTDGIASEGDAASVPSTDDVPADGDAGNAEADAEETISVLEFVLGDERYCLDITYIEQIVERGTVTRIPNAPPFVDGVIDLRGDVTTVIDPTETLATDGGGDGGRIVVFDSDRMDDDWSVGWAVDGVRRVSTVSLAEVKDSPVDESWINGVVKRDDDGEFVIWTEPGELMRVDDETSSGDV